ncbi:MULTISPECIES: hypothetical protein [Myroides]|uniref:hypothetical protein n=1 Tax=Myroides TaxID=76831 RepID=UPI002576B8F4|nr:hypothetical protein [Myroides marinus]MDM1404493.1 hypothetical protein [Myroides marinus]
MKKNQNNPNNAFQHKRQGKDTQKISEITVFYDYLKNHLATSSMASKATGIAQKNLTRYKSELEEQGLLYCVKKDYCKSTRRKAWYLTTNRSLFNEFTQTNTNQLKLF